MKQGQIPTTANVAGVVVAIPVTPGSTVTLNVTLGTVAKWTAAQSTTVIATGSQYLGQSLTLFVVNDGVLPRVLSFGSGFRVGASITGLLGKTAVFKFESDGTNFYITNTPSFS